MEYSDTHLIGIGQDVDVVKDQLVGHVVIPKGKVSGGQGEHC